MKLKKTITESFTPRPTKWFGLRSKKSDLVEAKAAADMTAQNKRDKKEKKAKNKKTYTLKFYMLVLSGAGTVIGLGLFVIYFVTLKMFLGVPSIILIVAGIVAFRHYWQKGENITVEHIGGIKKEDANSLIIYPDRVEFGNVYEPVGFPMQCLNDKQKYYVHIQDKVTKKLVPFVLPDQQYCDPIVFAQRVLGLPAHKKIFERKPKLLQRLKTAILVIAIGIMWLVILTTTGGA